MKKYFLLFIVLLLILGLSFIFTNTLEKKVTDSFDAVSIKKEAGNKVASLTTSKRIELSKIIIVKPKEIKNRLPDGVTAEDRQFALDPSSNPPEDVVRLLLKLVDEGDADAEFALLQRATECRSAIELYNSYNNSENPEIKEKYSKGIIDENCPGTGLEEFGRSNLSRYTLVLDAAEKGSLGAMTLLIDTPPPPFENLKELYTTSYPEVRKRAHSARGVARHFETAREYLEFAAQQGYPRALLRSADLYAYGLIVDPDIEKSAFYTLAYHEVTGLPIPGYLQTDTIDGLSTERYNKILARAKRFAAQF